MTVTEEQSTSHTDRLLGFVGAAGETKDVPRFVTAALGLVAAVLVAASTASAIHAGHTAIALSFLTAVGLFMGTVLIFETGRRLGEAR